MPFKTPDLQETIEAAYRAFEAEMKGSDARLWPNNVHVSAKVMGGAVWPVFAYLDYIARQARVSTAEGPWLDRHGADYGVARLGASYAQGKAAWRGDPGTVVPAGIEVQRVDGVIYDVTLGGTVDGNGDVTLTLRAREPGRAGNAAAGVKLILSAPVSGLETEGAVHADGIGLGADPEGDEAYRARLLHRLQYPPHGGAAHDYVAWAREVAGVTRVFVDPVTATNGRSTVGVWFCMDDLYSDGIPQQADVDAVAAYIDTVRPAGAIVTVAAPVAKTVDVTIANLTPDTSAVRDAIRAELADMIRREGRVSTLTDPFTLYRSKISEAISIAAGEAHHTLTAPAADIVCATGEMPVLGTITFS